MRRRLREERQDLPPLTDWRERRLKIRKPLEIIAVEAGIPGSTLSAFERGVGHLGPAQLERLVKTLGRYEAHEIGGGPEYVDVRDAGRTSRPPIASDEAPTR